MRERIGIKLSAWFIVIAVVMSTMGGQAKADVMFSLDCTMDSNVCTSGGPFGSIILADNGNNIDVTAALLNTRTAYVISLNWDSALGGILPTSGWSVSGGNIGPYNITVSENSTGYWGGFDIKVEDINNISNPLYNSLQFTLSNSTIGNLDASFFNAKDVMSQVYAVLKTGPTTMTSGDSIYYGALTSAVPEPTTMLLLGLGLLGLACVRKRMI